MRVFQIVHQREIICVGLTLLGEIFKTEIGPFLSKRHSCSDLGMMQSGLPIEAEGPKRPELCPRKDFSQNFQ